MLDARSRAEYGRLMNRALPVSAEYRKTVFQALALQAVMVALSQLVLDFGTSARICGLALLGFWAGVALIIARRPSTPTRTDLALIRIGFLPLLGLAVPVVLWVWRLRGSGVF